MPCEHRHTGAVSGLTVARGFTLSPPEGHWKVKVSLPQTPNQGQSNHTGTGFYCERSTVSVAVERRGLMAALTLKPVEEREGHHHLSPGAYTCPTWCIHMPGKNIIRVSLRRKGSGKACQKRGHFQ